MERQAFRERQLFGGDEIEISKPREFSSLADRYRRCCRYETCCVLSKDPAFRRRPWWFWIVSILCTML